MLREESKFFVRAHKILDICLTSAAFIAAYFLKREILPLPFRGLTIAPNYYIVLLIIIIVWSFSFEQFGLYVPSRRLQLRKNVGEIVKAVGAGMLVLILAMYVLKITDVSRLMLGVFFVLDIVFLATGKWIIYSVLCSYRQRGYNVRNVLVVGSRARAREVIDAVSEHSEAGFRILGCLEVDAAEVGSKVGNGVQVIDTIANLPRLVNEQVIDEIIIAMPIKKVPDYEKMIMGAEDVGITVRIVPDWQINKVMYTPNLARIYFEEFLGLIIMTLTTTPPLKAELIIKNMFDFVFAALMLVVLSPLFLLIALVIKLSSSGPVIYSQERCGLNGRRFMVYKFRTMYEDAEVKRSQVDVLNEAKGPVFKVRKDPRIVPWVGTFLRRTGLDELPQLINIIKGEMSLIGPRPPIPSEVEKYETWQRRRISMKPGITCIWQTTGHRHDVAFDEWMQMDFEYIDNWSLMLDFKIFWKTIKVMLTGAGR